MTEERIIELEIKQAYQEDLLQELNVVVAKQQQQISRLEATCTLLYERMKSLAATTELTPSDHQPPPHY